MWVALVAIATVVSACAGSSQHGPPAAAVEPTAPVATSAPTTTHAPTTVAARPIARATSRRVYVAGPSAEPAPPPSPQTPIAVPVSTDLAFLAGDVAHYPYPGAPSDGTIPATWYGYQTVLPVIDGAPGWVEVRVAQRPNMSVTWIRAQDVDLRPTDYFLVLDLRSTHLRVFQAGQEIMSLPAGVGTPSAPTPTGTFFIAFQAPPPNPGYGPFVMVTSAHSNAISDWEGEGDAITAIHGPITARDDARIGTTGARISHGCVRLHDSDVARLNGIPAGTPLDIVD
ncbi:MAG: L,D-transpeptidase [Acidimicrobiales bacterium]